MTAFVLSVVIALSISALCSLLEAALLSLTPSQVAELSQRRPHVGAMWQHFKTHIERPIAVILIINTAAHTIGATIAGSKFEEISGEGVFWFSLLFTYLMLQFTEILPKTLGVSYNRQLAPVIAYPLAVLIRVFYPIIWLIRLINRPFERRRGRERQEATLEEIAALAGLARLSNLISPHQERIIQGASRLSTLTARDIMIPIEQVTMLPVEASLEEAVGMARLDAHTRFPVCEGRCPDRILGYVNFKEMMYQQISAEEGPHQEQPLRNMLRPVRFVAPGEAVPQLLRVFVDQHEHMALVRGLDGRTLGLVTLEDLIEELVGELEDEFDRLPRMLHPVGGAVWMVGGGLPIRELASRLGLELPGPTGTTSAWLIRTLGRVPRTGEAVTVSGTTFTIRRTRRGKVFEVAVRRAPQASGAG